MSLTYSTYLKIDELLSLQEPRTESPEPHEMLFIVIHQASELWFKQILHELDYLRDAFEKNETPRILQTLKRVLSIWKTVIVQIDILETMTPTQFISFRNNLGSASGFQSAQFRELEFVLGLKRRSILNHFPKGSEEWQRLASRYRQPTVWDAFLRYLTHNAYAVPETLLTRDVTETLEPSAEVPQILIDIYRQDPQTTLICERLVELDENLQEWRYRHVKLAERMIGIKPGSGGSSGIKYLKSTLFKPLFPDLWQVRSEL